MQPRTIIQAEDGRQDLLITRDFNLPLELLFKAYVEPELVEQWMGTNVLKLENKQHGSWQVETTDAEGNVVFRANGVIHEFEPNSRITRTFKMENTPFPVQLEFLEFKERTPDSSTFIMHIVFKSVEARNQLLELPFKQGVTMAHNRLQDLISTMQ